MRSGLGAASVTIVVVDTSGSARPQHSNLAWPELVECLPQSLGQRQEIGQSVGSAAKDDDPEREVLDLLLLRDTFIDRHQGVEGSLDPNQEGTIVEIAKAELGSCPDVES